MQHWPPIPETPEGPADAQGFTESLSEAFGEDLSLDETGGTYEIEAENFSLSFTLEDSVFEIRNIEAQGVGRKVVEAIHEFADEHGLAVEASNVKDEARGFWEKMGYEEGSDSEQFFRR